MSELDKVIKAWECCNPLNRRCFECPYDADCFHDNFDRVAIADMVKLLKEKQPKKGEWIEHEDVSGDLYYDCSVCGESWVLIDGTPKENGMDYCPHCGADMRNDGDGE